MSRIDGSLHDTPCANTGPRKTATPPSTRENINTTDLVPQAVTAEVRKHGRAVSEVHVKRGGRHMYAVSGLTTWSISSSVAGGIGDGGGWRDRRPCGGEGLHRGGPLHRAACLVPPRRHGRGQVGPALSPRAGGTVMIREALAAMGVGAVHRQDAPGRPRAFVPADLSHPPRLRKPGDDLLRPSGEVPGDQLSRHHDHRGLRGLCGPPAGAPLSLRPRDLPAVGTRRRGVDR